MGKKAQRAKKLIKDEKLVSRGLKGAARFLPPPFGTIADAAGTAAGALGFRRAIRASKGRGPRRARGMAESILATTTQGMNEAVQADNAPVAFGRQKLKQCFDMQTLPDGNVEMHSLELVGQLQYSATVTTWQPTQLNGGSGWWESPLYAQQHPWLNTMANHYEQFRIKSLRLHYQHFAPTTVQGAVVMYYNPDALYNVTSQTTPQMAALTMTQVMNSEWWVEGALYEDYCLEVPFSPDDVVGQWKYCMIASATSSPACFANDLRLSSIGEFNVYFHDTAVATGFPATGDLFIETVYEFKTRRSPSIIYGMATELIKAEQSSPEVGADIFRRAVLRTERHLALEWSKRAEDNRLQAEAQMRKEKEEDDEIARLLEDSKLAASLSFTPAALVKPRFPSVSAGGRSA